MADHFAALPDEQVDAFPGSDPVGDLPVAGIHFRSIQPVELPDLPVNFRNFHCVRFFSDLGFAQIFRQFRRICQLAKDHFPF